MPEIHSNGIETELKHEIKDSSLENFKTEVSGWEIISYNLLLMYVQMLDLLYFSAILDTRKYDPRDLFHFPKNRTSL